ncbi:class I SAM-dependent methyltransferase [Shewanella psychrotolerans]|uniref:class I SAM-dependent methyltransferase n=1 Tax=Shewanella psychrotolerans TaxID=2864206 RepID=UPI001C65B36B|nr:class I SAM-dependent methyltransferase [Shewanella psychrotolerans]QYK03142.1 methyltransferase domain-containing protein [Shewanella psychrotolerans]
MMTKLNDEHETFNGNDGQKTTRIMADFYTEHVKQLSTQYNAQRFEDVHQSWQAYWPKAEQRVLDVGAGTGRDAKWFCNQGCDVYAIEPNDEMRAAGRHYTQSQNVTWLNDTLPELKNILSLGIQFDVILVSAVWMHLAESHRQRAFRKLSNLLAPNGKLVITLRHGEFNDGRVSYPVSVTEQETLAKAHGLQVVHVQSAPDNMKRDTVRWETVVLNMPDDGSGALLKIRHILVNDSKVATYKLALLRALVRIANAHPGSIIDKTDGKVALPLGLVALYWTKQYRRLLSYPVHQASQFDHHESHSGIQQSSNTTKGLGFIKDNWRSLHTLGANDLSIGALFLGQEARAVTGTLSDCATTIRDMPVKHLWHKDKTNHLFQVNKRTVRKSDRVIIDKQYLDSFGEFILDEQFWQSLKVFGSWIEPLIVNQWIGLMQSFELNKSRYVSLEQYHQALQWEDAKHDTRAVRQRAEELIRETNRLKSVWSGKDIRKKYHIDHCIPFAHWPNNNLWNLLPTSDNENLNKKDRVPSASKLQQSRTRVLDWWREAWKSEEAKQTFMIQSVMALPGLPNDTGSFDDVFEAMNVQVKGVKGKLLLREWHD